MRDVFGIPQTVLIIGGNSEIATAILEKLVELNRLDSVFLVTRDGTWENSERALSAGDSSSINISTFAFSTFSIERDLQGKSIDLCIIATGFLAREEQSSFENISNSIEGNTILPIRYAESIAVHMKQQGYGVIVALSSIAAIRIRPANWVYGITKSIFDRYLFELAEKLKDTGVKVLIVRPGMVRTTMSRHLEEMPFTTNPADVADKVIANLLQSSGVIWVPGHLKYVAFALRIIPNSVLKFIERT